MEYETGVVPDKPHSKILAAIDGCVLDCVTSYTQMERWLGNPVGSITKVFGGDQAQGNTPAILGFYPSFSALFLLTSGLKGMQKDHKDLVDQVDAWLEPVRMGYDLREDTERLRAGMRYYKKYMAALSAAGFMELKA